VDPADANQPPEARAIQFRPPRSSLAVGRRFRLLVHDALPGAGVKPTAPPGFDAIGRLDLRPSPNETWLVVPSAGNDALRDHLWAEGRFAAWAAAEQTLAVAMALPTETEPERKAEAQHLHDRALRLAGRVDAMGAAGVGDLHGFERDLRDALHPPLSYLGTCARQQADGSLRSLLWPSVHEGMAHVLRASLQRTQAIADGSLPAWGDVLATSCRDVAHGLSWAARLLDDAERDRVAEATRLARDLATMAQSPAEPPAALPAAEAALQWHGKLARDAESAAVRGIVHPVVAEHLRRCAAKAHWDLQRAAGRLRLGSDPLTRP